MKNTFQKSKYSVDQLQARKNFENAIVSCPEKLEKDEVNVLSWRFGLFGRQRHDLSDLAIRMRRQMVYLDTTLLPLQECMRSIEGFGPLAQILTHFSGKTCHLGCGLAK